MDSSSMKIHEISKQIIKPSLPTSPLHKQYNLSSMDQLNPPIYMPNVFFYPTSPQQISEISHRLKFSLSETLTQYYPFAGRMTSGTYIDCNDEGAEFQEAMIECRLSEIVARLEESEDVSTFFAPGTPWGSLNNRSKLVVIRVTHFQCGGIAISICISHKLGDASTGWNFINHWATRTRKSGEQVPPYFISLPSNELKSYPEFAHMKKYWVTRKFVFSNSQIAHLKAKVSKYEGQIPSRVSLVVALLFKCAIEAVRANSGSFQPSSLTHLVNMRSKLVQPLPQSSIGNIYWKVIVEARTESESQLNLLTDQMKKKELQLRGLQRLDGNKYWSDYKEDRSKKYKEYLSSSLCGIRNYEIDFGWGKPSRVCYAGTSLNNMFMLQDTPKGDGIEALVSLTEQDMAKFQLNKELLAISSSL